MARQLPSNASALQMGGLRHVKSTSIGSARVRPFQLPRAPLVWHTDERPTHPIRKRFLEVSGQLSKRGLKRVARFLCVAQQDIRVLIVEDRIVDARVRDGAH